MLPFSLALLWKCNSWIVARVVETFVFIVATITVTLLWKCIKLIVMQQYLSRYQGNAIWCIDQVTKESPICRNIISFDLHTLYKTLFDATEHNVSVSHFRSIWTLFLLLKTFYHEWSSLVTLCNELLYNTNIELYTVSVTFLMQPNTISQFLTFFTSGHHFYCWTRFDTNGHAS
jgi:hypothetical protein